MEGGIQELEAGIQEEFQRFYYKQQVAGNLIEQHETQQNNALLMQERVETLQRELQSIQIRVQELMSMAAQSEEEINWLKEQLNMFQHQAIQVQQELQNATNALVQIQQGLQQLERDRVEMGKHCAECGKIMQRVTEAVEQELTKPQKEVREMSAVLSQQFGNAQMRQAHSMGIEMAARYQKCAQDSEELTRKYIQLAAWLLQVTQEDATKKTGQYLRPFTKELKRRR